MPQLQGDEFARPMADAMGDVVAGDVENLAVVGDAPDHDVGVGMAGVVMVDGDPVEPRVEVLLHLPHEVAGEAAQVAHLGGVLWRDDEAELMSVLSTAFDEGATIRFILDRRIGASLFSFPGHAVAFEIAQMRVGRAARDAAHFWTRVPPWRCGFSFTTRALTTTRRARYRPAEVAAPSAALRGQATPPSSRHGRAR